MVADRSQQEGAGAILNRSGELEVMGKNEALLGRLCDCCNSFYGALATTPILIVVGVIKNNDAVRKVRILLDGC